MPSDRRLTVLVLDDDRHTCAAHSAVIESLGHTALPHDDPRAALETLRTQTIDLLITDFAMPQMTGLDLVEKLRALVVPQPYVILITSTPDELPKPRLTGLRIRGVLQKPTDRSSIAAHVEACQSLARY